MNIRLMVAFCLLATPALAQDKPPPNVLALQQTVIKLTGEAIDWQTQAIALQAQVADLQKQLAAAQAKSQEPRP